MTFNYKDLLQELANNLKAAAMPHIPEITGATATYLIDNAERLQGLAEGEFDSDYINERLKEEPDIFKAQLISFEVFGSMVAKDAQDATVKTIVSIVMHVVGTLIVKAV